MKSTSNITCFIYLFIVILTFLIPIRLSGMFSSSKVGFIDALERRSLFLTGSSNGRDVISIFTNYSRLFTSEYVRIDVLNDFDFSVIHDYSLTVDSTGYLRFKFSGLFETFEYLASDVYMFAAPTSSSKLNNSCVLDSAIVKVKYGSYFCSDFQHEKVNKSLTGKVNCDLFVVIPLRCAQIDFGHDIGEIYSDFKPYRENLNSWKLLDYDFYIFIKIVDSNSDLKRARLLDYREGVDIDQFDELNEFSSFYLLGRGLGPVLKHDKYRLLDRVLPFNLESDESSFLYLVKFYGSLVSLRHNGTRTVLFKFDSSLKMNSRRVLLARTLVVPSYSLPSIRTIWRAY